MGLLLIFRCECVRSLAEGGSARSKEANNDMQGANTDTIDSLMDDLQNGDRGIVRRAVDALIARGSREPGLVESLESRLRDDATRWRWPVAYTLGHLTAASGDCLEVLAGGLGSDDQDVRWATQRLLTELGGSQAQARNVLLTLLHKGGATQRRMAIYCLRDVGLSDDSIAEEVVEACHDLEPLVRVAAVTSLARRQPLPARAMPILQRLADADPDGRVRNAAHFVLGRVFEN